ncbi:MAG: peptidoglycan editing factor PgeF [Acidobacteriota bacterium]|nr:peptidoglycan editing factor PgeF [Acidobacteriota bacterium]
MSESPPALSAGIASGRSDDAPRLWRDRLGSASGGSVEVLFVGRGAPRDAQAALALLEPSPPRIVWAQQIHSDRVLPAGSGDAGGSCGEGDALITAEADLALCVVTADCVPVLLAGAGADGIPHLAAAHAGWRGIAADILAKTLEALPIPAPQLTAWIGPAIGPCCYEVGTDVADQVQAAAGPSVVHARPGAKPHLDLPAAAELQLRRRGVEIIHRVGPCTRCSPDDLWSYRREGAGAGRNLAFIWRRSQEA